MERRISLHISEKEHAPPPIVYNLGEMRRALFIAGAALAACGPAAVPGRVQVPGLDRVSGELTTVEVDLAGSDPAAVRGQVGWVLVGATVEAGRVTGGAAPDCALRRTASGALAAQTARCAGLLGAYAALDRARAFLISAGAEALPAAPIAVDAADAPAGLHYVAEADAYTLTSGPAGARIPAALNPGAVAREAARRQLRSIARSHPDDVEAVALFLVAAVGEDPGYLGASDGQGDPTGELDLARPLPAGAPASAVLAGALWAWADASGDPVGAARAALAAVRAIGDRPDAGGGAEALLSLVAGQLEGAERDQACAVFRAHLAAAGIEACP
jgi:hypothetical protein